MHRVFVKIEGLRDPATAAGVARLGADAVGLVFAESPRRVTPQQAKEIVAAVPASVATIGVFVNSSADEINRVVEQTGIQIVQLHGDEPPSVVREIRTPCIKAFRVKDEAWAEEVKDWLEKAGSLGMRVRETASETERRKRTESAAEHTGEGDDRTTQTGFLQSEGGTVPGIRKCTILLDAYAPAVRGGSGRRFNWDLIARVRVQGETARMGPIILAGGLDASCVGEAIAKVRPWGVDVASGVESAPGVKDLGKVKAFIDAVRAMERGPGTGDRGPGTR
jgi:phosphoribosylanthranilate isomerase